MGTGVFPVVNLSPPSLSFTGQAVGTTSASTTITLTNVGGVPLTISSISVTGDFAQTNSCGATLAVGLSCSIAVTFSPTAAGMSQGTLAFTDNASDSPQTLRLFGLAFATQVALSPTSLSFSGQAVGTTSAAQLMTLSNTGSLPLSISGITTFGDFSQTNSCGRTLAAGANCSVSVTFTPTAAGTSQGLLAITDNAVASPQTVALTGTGLVLRAALSPASLTFGGQAVGTSSASQTVTLSNTGGAPLSISGIVVNGDFSQVNSCGATLAAGASCPITVTFTPTVAGTRQGTLTITDNAPGGPQTVSLTGTGLIPQVSLSAANLSFGGQAVGTTSSSQTVTLSNTGSAPLAISSIAVNGDFAQINSCGTTLAAGANCSMVVTFTPTATGTRQGALTVTDNASGSPQTVSLSGTGLVPQAVLSPTTVSFGGQPVGTSSASQTVTLSNPGGAPLVISAITTNGDFSQTKSCGASLAAGASCSVAVVFAPTAAGTRQGTLSVTDNASGSPQTVSLTGNGLVPQAVLSPPTVSFAGQAAGTTSPSQTVTLSNPGGAQLVISGIAATGDFSQTNSCGGTLAAGASCAISVSFRPIAGGTRQGTLSVTDNASGSLQKVSLSGTGLVPVGVISPASLSFGDQIVGTTGAVQTAIFVEHRGSAAGNFRVFRNRRFCPDQRVWQRARRWSELYRHCDLHAERAWDSRRHSHCIQQLVHRYTLLVSLWKWIAECPQLRLHKPRVLQPGRRNSERRQEHQADSEWAGPSRDLLHLRYGSIPGFQQLSFVAQQGIKLQYHRQFPAHCRWARLRRRSCRGQWLRESANHFSQRQWTRLHALRFAA
jgi:Abnormal spindle-like microcephaly-assoc'd, ASPM-SPD-2-Hydin